MKFQLHVEFESLEEYLTFSRMLLQAPEKPAPSSSKAEKPVKAIRRFDNVTAVHTIDLPPTKGFRLTDEQLLTVQKFIARGESFHASDIIGEKAVQNAKRRTFVNQWLKSFPQLTYDWVKSPGSGGRGRLMYTPVKVDNEKIILPRGAKPTKSDWPIKGASTRKSFAPIEIPDDEEFTVSDASNN